MTQTDTRSTKQLFKEWRGGDADAGSLMAQRFADWYYAIATSKLGEGNGSGPTERACARFGEGIINVTESRALVRWAHDIIVDELKTAGERATDGNEPNAYTGNQKPKALLARAKADLPGEMALLEAVYGNIASDEEIEKLAEPLGGNPMGVLKARYALKRWLRDHARVPFDVAPDSPILDRAPLPLYESNKMASPDEEVNFEHWMLTDLDLCKDIAEFAHFAIALRGGVPADAANDTSAPAAKSAASDDGGGAGVGAAGAAAAGGVALLGVGAVGLIVVALVAAYFIFG